MTAKVSLVKTVRPARRRTPWAGVGPRARRFWRRPGVQHAWAAQNRFLDRLGIQFAAALTYFSFLALVPLLMLAFSVAGFVLANQPSLLTGLQNDIAQALPKSLSDTVNQILATAVDARLTVGILGLAFAIYSGISWMGNLRSAIQAMWRPDFDTGSEIRAESSARLLLAEPEVPGFPRSGHPDLAHLDHRVFLGAIRGPGLAGLAAQFPAHPVGHAAAGGAGHGRRCADFHLAVLRGAPARHAAVPPPADHRGHHHVGGVRIAEARPSPICCLCC